jgi:hypothetical protein
MAESGGRYCPLCGRAAGLVDRFCASCGYNLSVPPVREGRVETEQDRVRPPPPDYQRSGPGVGSWVKLFFGGCIVLPILILIFLFIVAPFLSGLLGGSGQ